MVSLSQNPKNKSPRSIFKSISGLMIWMIWVLIFFAGTVKGNIPHSQLIKATKAAVASTNNKASLPFNDSDPLQLPEESEVLSNSLDDELDEGKKVALAIFSLQLFGFKQTIETLSVQSFQYEQAIQQIIAIPLFVLHHSWKSHLA